MGTADYPWNTQILIEWLKLELINCGSCRALSTALHVSPDRLTHWFNGSRPRLTLQDIRCIAQYRCWNVRQTLRWLELQPAHVDALIVADPLSYRVSWSDAKALWFGPPAA